MCFANGLGTLAALQRCSSWRPRTPSHRALINLSLSLWTSALQSQHSPGPGMLVAKMIVLEPPQRKMRLLASSEAPLESLAPQLEGNETSLVPWHSSSCARLHSSVSNLTPLVLPPYSSPLLPHLLPGSTTDVKMVTPTAARFMQASRARLFRPGGQQQFG